MERHTKSKESVESGHNGEPIESKAPGKRRRWTARRKRDIVLEGLSGKASVAEVCRREGITQSMFYEWKEAALAKMEEALAYGGRTKEEYEKDKEIERLQRKIGQLTMDVEILKKVREERLRRERRSDLFGKRGTP